MGIFDFASTIKRGHGYMLRNDGKIISCGSEIKYAHPYILSNSVINDVDNVIELLQDDEYYQEQFLWFYFNTNNKTTKNLYAKVMDDLIEYAKEYGMSYHPLYGLFSRYKSSDGSAQQAKTDLQLLNNEVNQEFLRFRLGDKYQVGHGSGDIYFRISSTKFNWFNYIWNIVYKNKHIIDTVTICKDFESTGQEYNYQHNGQKIYQMPVDEFISMQGNPITEKLIESFDDYVSVRLNYGNSLIESFNKVNYDKINKYFQQIRYKDLSI